MIIFKTLSYRNFLSTGNYKTVIDLRKNNNTLISGDNGAGKSTMLDALTYSLFGRSFRGTKIPQLINSINNKECETEIEFLIGRDEYKIIRGLKPKRFEIYMNGDLLDQDAKSRDYQKILEEQILKMSYKSFCQVVILGSSNYVPFMKLSTTDRRLVVENLLDIDVFSVMNTLVRARLQMTKDYIKEIDHKIELTKEKVDAKNRLINTLEKKSSDNIYKFKEDVEESQKHIKEWQDEVDKYQSNVDKLLEDVKDKVTITKKLLKAESIENKLNTKLKTLNNSIRFYEENDSCPSCKQDITESHKNEVFEEKNKKN